MDLEEILAGAALEPPPGAVVDFENPPNMTALGNSVAIAGLVVTSLTVLIRIHSWAFVLTSVKGRLEAFLVISGFASYIGFAYSLLRIGTVELGWWVHQWNVTVGDTIPFAYWVYIAGLLYNSAIAPVKVAILVEWMRIFSPRNHNAFWWLCQIVLWINTVYYIAATIVEAMQCTPRARIWDPTVDGTCLPTKVVEVASSTINVISDVVILVAPQFVIWRLQLSKGKKVGVALVFAVGLFGTISSIFRLVATQAYLRSEDSTYTVSAVGFWAYSEMTSVFLVYGLPAIPSFYASASSRLSLYYTHWTNGKLSSQTRKDSFDPNQPRSRYRHIGKNAHTQDSIDLRSFSQWEAHKTILDDPVAEPPPVGVLRTIEIQSDADHRPTPRNGHHDSGEDILLRQHPWVTQ
ncbi:hypothetical protein F5Y18DRAFT_436429 [Xylariaceae sp. FL1019]|nr:hypothetical protein F5Y18DRAFT_436429 [Xylariaceae sp. FL1019]